MATEELGTCTAHVIGFLGKEFTEEVRNDGKPFLETTMYCVRSIKHPDGQRQRHVNQFRLTANGTAAANLARNFRQGAKVYIAGELTIHRGYADLHCAQLHWLNGGQQL